MNGNIVLEKWETEIIFNMVATQMAVATEMPSGIPAMVFMAEAIASYIAIRNRIAPNGMQSLAEAQALLQHGGGLYGEAARAEQIGHANKHFTAALDDKGRLFIRPL